MHLKRLPSRRTSEGGREREREKSWLQRAMECKLMYGAMAIEGKVERGIREIYGDGGEETGGTRSRFSYMPLGEIRAISLRNRERERNS